ncbi:MULTISPECIES: long-chain-fatty-acid--AMP ligase FadD32 [unclassified Mycolicibacterium]|uniref:long-chain-fatty-acid--AMP ligase FadD32 n=1 Tax=unclassified Mycolicibacterium TaxID=2636767 RepID=UPI0012DCD846|nr:MULTISPECIES: long-chain-fatty-acid--AMP ligase FadD32 [unclassified Mycolicibacterium]MUL83235.1 AMP-binding protein [Mycolicibacterium sp. CBMA 329]MUL89570.1 AMP-binding protein [Mycolicibacterium sp. CBMA 331]MUM02674.1 AMP-binding protein [Mycolicibacterium sp. CBMA 334]MUM39086.1 AMP-binding protein [Mycolicibacterium sp. CBMA 247]MUM45634.1 AMP-binding protein [Mycolicibacterium sp. CBMA 294]
MPFINPFIKDGQIKFPDGASIVEHVERWARVRSDKLAYRFLDFSTERDGVARDLTWSQFSARNKAVAARLQQVTQPGDRVAILCPQNLDYLVAFFGALYAGRVAVPLFDPSEPGHVGRLHAVLDDCHPSAVLTTTEAAEGVRKFFRGRPANQRPRVIAVDAVPDDVAATWVHFEDVDESTIAYLQYTSGSTRIPTGVQITHLNMATNVVQIVEALEGEEGDRGLSWLPFFHDMGLVTGLIAPMIGHYFTFMTPAAFVRRPERWIREMARKEGDTGGVISVAPNFAFDHAAARGVPKDGAPLDLSNVKAVLNGSEPISAATVRRFNEAFSPFGFPAKAIKPSYGLAEATLMVSTTPAAEEPKIIYVDRGELNSGRIVEVDGDSIKAVAQASAGRVGVSEWAVIVDAESATELADGQIGEIWMSGQNMGTGYWGKPEESVEVFQNTLKSRTSPSHAEGAEDDATWVRTGDFGAFYDGDLYITGRVKDLVIIDGRNHYPQDLEYSAQEASKALRTGYVAAFSVPANQLPDEVFENAHAGLHRDEDDSSEQLVIVAERAPGSHKLEVGPITDDIRAAIAVRHGVTVRDVLLTAAGAVPRTSSGKIGRRACRSAYLDGTLRSGKIANDFPDETD